jgi:hypothetical protein
MAWVVKRWRTEGLERLLSEDAVAAAHVVRAAAERDARHARRAADRAAADAAAELDALERLGTELRAMVRRRRVSDAGGAAWERTAPAVSGPATLLLAAAAVARAASAATRPATAAPSTPALDGRPAAPAPSMPALDARLPTPAPSARAAGPAPANPLGPAPAPPPRRRPGRASMRSSALGELFRATTAP